jgi:hypothetical protein
VRQNRKGPLKQLQSLSWRGRGHAGTCTAEVDQPIRGYRVGPKNKSPGAPESAARAPTVSWISFDGEVYWVRLSDAQGWPRTIRVTQGDVDGAALTR